MAINVDEVSKLIKKKTQVIYKKRRLRQEKRYKNSPQNLKTALLKIKNPTLSEIRKDLSSVYKKHGAKNVSLLKRGKSRKLRIKLLKPTKIDIVDLGIFSIELNLAENSEKLPDFKSTDPLGISSSIGYIHPCINTSIRYRGVCFGKSKHHFGMAIRNGSMSYLVDVAENFLSSYDPGDNLRSLDYWLRYYPECGICGVREFNNTRYCSMCQRYICNSCQIIKYNEWNICESCINNLQKMLKESYEKAKA